MSNKRSFDRTKFYTSCCLLSLRSDPWTLKTKSSLESPSVSVSETAPKNCELIYQELPKLLERFNGGKISFQFIEKEHNSCVILMVRKPTPNPLLCAVTIRNHDIVNIALGTSPKSWALDRFHSGRYTASMVHTTQYLQELSTAVTDHVLDFAGRSHQNADPMHPFRYLLMLMSQIWLVTDRNCAKCRKYTDQGALPTTVHSQGGHFLFLHKHCVHTPTF